MMTEAGREGLAASLARARVAVLALAPPEDADLAVHAPPDDDWRDASAAVAALLPAFEEGDDVLRTLLAADMRQAIDDVAEGPRDDRTRAKLVSLLDQALAVLAGAGPDDVAGSVPSRSPLALTNELRALRGAPLLTGNMVFAIGLEGGTASGESDVSAQGDPRLASSARRLRSYYQQGLVAWLRDPRYAKAAATRIGEVCARLHALTRGTDQEVLWQAGASFARLLEDPRWRMRRGMRRRRLLDLPRHCCATCFSTSAKVTTSRPPSAFSRRAARCWLPSLHRGREIRSNPPRCCHC
jgi:hypothetical protein